MFSAFSRYCLSMGAYVPGYSRTVEQPRLRSLVAACGGALREGRAAELTRYDVAGHFPRVCRGISVPRCRDISRGRTWHMKGETCWHQRASTQLFDQVKIEVCYCVCVYVCACVHAPRVCVDVCVTGWWAESPRFDKMRERVLFGVELE